MLPLAAAPILAVLLAVGLGIVTRSWLVGLANAALVVVWVAWFLAASNYSTSDLFIWASMAALALHSLVMLWLIVVQVVRRVEARSEA